MLERSSEKIGIAEHANGKDKWVVTHDYPNNRLLAWPITENGIGDSVESDLGYTFNLSHTFNRAGYLTFSRDYSKVAIALYFTGVIILYDFDNSTGEFSNPIVIESATDEYDYCYGIEFSPDRTKLYCTKRGRSPSRIFQFDISSENQVDIINSRELIADNDEQDYFCALMLGPDSRIYVASHNHGYLHRIDDPNAAGSACGFSENAVYLEGRTCKKGLPTRAIAVSAIDTSSTGPDDTSKVVGLHPEIQIACEETACAVPGTKINIYYTLKLSEDILESGDKSGLLEAKFLFDRFLLFPDDKKVTAQTMLGEDLEIVFQENISAHSNYVFNSSLSFYAGLGKRTRTDITLTALQINGIDYMVDTLEITDGCACIEVCNEGGARLVNPENETTIASISPNPAESNFSIEINLIEIGQTELYLLDILGRPVKTLLSEDINETGERILSFGTPGLQSGLYSLMLKTPTITRNAILSIVK